MARPNNLYLITGMPAAGKSTFARELAQRVRACLIDIDTCTENVVQAAMKQLTGDPDDRDSQRFKETFRSPIYDTLFAIADENLPHTHAIITGPFTKELRNPQWPQAIQARLSTPCILRCVFVHCDHQLRKKRLVERGNPRDNAKLKDWEAFLQYYEQDAFPEYPHLRVDTGQSDPFEKAIRDGLLD